uniref:hypothetical protein n=1 Tax=uncultured Draconibacterium sp. TaxID=1573823 RepID=UPI0032171DEA
MHKLFNFLQYLYFPFYVLTIFYIVKGSIIQFNLEDVGFGILCMGIAFGFSSMGDITKISKKEKKLFSNEKRFNRIVVYLVVIGFTTMIVTILFISQKWIKNNAMGEQFYQLGLNCSPLIIAVFFSLKQLIDKRQYFNLHNE